MGLRDLIKYRLAHIGKRQGAHDPITVPVRFRKVCQNHAATFPALLPSLPEVERYCHPNPRQHSIFLSTCFLGEAYHFLLFGEDSASEPVRNWVGPSKSGHGFEWTNREALLFRAAISP